MEETNTNALKNFCLPIDFLIHDFLPSIDPFHSFLAFRFRSIFLTAIPLVFASICLHFRHLWGYQIKENSKVKIVQKWNVNHFLRRI